MDIDKPVVEIFSQGEEIISGQTVDTNAAWLAMELAAMGFVVSRHTAVGDCMHSLVGLLREISARADCCICSGGLGPTSDDLTAGAVAEAFERPLGLDTEALQQIRSYFKRGGGHMPAVNEKQAMLPEASTRLDNHWGTAPGFVLREGRCRFAFLPGVPYEMKKMFNAAVKPALEKDFNLLPLRRVTLRTVGIGESTLQERIDRVDFPAGVLLSFCTGPEENQTRLSFERGWSESRIAAFTEEVAGAIGKPVFAIDGVDGEDGDLVAVVGRFLAADQQTLAVAETLSGGAMAARCAGFSWFREGLVVSDYARLCERLGLPRAALESGDDVSRAVTTLASVLCERAGTDYGIAQLTSANIKDADAADTPLELFTAVCTPGGIYQDRCSLSGRRIRLQSAATSRGLDVLRRYLQGHL